MPHGFLIATMAVSLGFVLIGDLSRSASLAAILAYLMAGIAEARSAEPAARQAVLGHLKGAIGGKRAFRECAVACEIDD